MAPAIQYIVSQVFWLIDLNCWCEVYDVTEGQLLVSITTITDGDEDDARLRCNIYKLDILSCLTSPRAFSQSVSQSDSELKGTSFVD